MEPSARRELEILNSIAEGRPVSQRVLAERLGIALGLTNLYLKRLARKGYIKVTTIPRSRIRYLLTPRGIAEQTRLTYEYMRYSVQVYREAREALRRGLAPLGTARRVAIFGTGEVAELAYLTLKEMGIEPAAILDGRAGRFLGHAVRQIEKVSGDDYEAVVLATFASTDDIESRLVRQGIPRTRLVRIRGGHT